MIVPGTLRSPPNDCLRWRWAWTLSSPVRSSSTSTPTSSACGNSSSSASTSFWISASDVSLAAVACRIWVSASSLRSSRRTARWSATLRMPELTIGSRPELESSRLRISDSVPVTLTIVTLPSSGSLVSGALSRVSTRIRLLAIRISSSWRICVALWTLTPLTNVPLFEPRSSISHDSPVFHSRACCRETRMSGTKIWQSDRRPMTYSPSASL